jgi:quercetin dioxygenase-like cupin family protein
MLRIVIAATGGILCASAALAQAPAMHAAPPEGVKYLSAKEVTALTDKPGPGAKTDIISDHENYFVEYVTRSDTGNVVEVHAHWTDYFQILSGEATLTYGGTVTDPKDAGPGEIRGGSITGGKTQLLHAGDYLQIPPGTPHLLTPPAGGKITYVVFKGRL